MTRIRIAAAFAAILALVGASALARPNPEDEFRALLDRLIGESKRGKPAANPEPCASQTATNVRNWLYGRVSKVGWCSVGGEPQGTPFTMYGYPCYATAPLACETIVRVECADRNFVLAVTRAWTNNTPLGLVQMLGTDTRVGLDNTGEIYCNFSGDPGPAPTPDWNMRLSDAARWQRILEPRPAKPPGACLNCEPL